MVPLVDMHCHLLAGLDDGPRTWDDALGMCRIAHEEGTQMAAALAHQNERWKSVTPGLIREAVGSASPIEFVPRPQDDPTVRQPDITLARTELGWEPAVTLPDGLKPTIAWIRDAVTDPEGTT